MCIYLHWHISTIQYYIQKTFTAANTLMFSYKTNIFTEFVHLSIRSWVPVWTRWFPALGEMSLSMS